MWLELKGEGSVRCAQNPYCFFKRMTGTDENNYRGNQCTECGWWRKYHEGRKKKEPMVYKVVEFKFLQDMMVERQKNI